MLVAGSMEDRVALVTGAASGMGRATVLAFVGEGARVVVSDVLEDGGQETVRLAREAGGEAEFIRCDVSRPEEVEALVRGTVEAFGRLDFAHNNAGIQGDFGRTHECSEENWDRTMLMNSTSVFLCMKYEISQMLSQGEGGAIVNTASGAGVIGGANMPAYVASKHAVVGLTKAAALEYGRAGIRVNVVCPGSTYTNFVYRILEADPDAEQELIDKYPMGRIGVPGDIAEAVVWLCSDSASWVTGVPFPIDGGFMAGPAAPRDESIDLPQAAGRRG